MPPNRERQSVTETLILSLLVMAGSGRYVVDSTGYHSVIVNGETLLRDGADTGRRPGVVLRG